MSEVELDSGEKKKTRVLGITRKVIQFLSFIIINYALLELIFNADFSLLSDLLRVLPFIHSANSVWTAGAGILEYAFHSITQGAIPWFFIGLIGIFGLFSGRIFCGWVCPAGFVQDLFAGLADEHRRFSIQTDKFLKNVKMVVLVGFIIIIAPVGYYLIHTPAKYYTYVDQIGRLAENPLWPISLSEFIFVTFPEVIQNAIEVEDVGQIFGGLSTFQIILIFFYVLLLVISVFYTRIYCRALCPYGAAISVFSNHSLLKLRRLPTRCPGRKECGVCEQVCPMQIRILDEPYDGFTGNGECILCLDCMEKCPHDAIKWKFGL